MKKLLCLIVCFFTASVNANLVTNGDFSTGDISGWSLSGGEFSEVETGFFREFDNSGWAILHQDIITASGQSYDISFDTYADVITGNEFAWAIDGVLHYIDTTTSWVTNLGSFIGAGGTTNIAFYMATDPGTGTWRLDNISVTTAASVTEPRTFVLLGLGLAGLGFSRRQKST